MREPDYKPKFKVTSEVLQRLFENGKSPLSQQFIRWKLWANWAQFVGPSLAEYTEPVGFAYGTLHIWVKNSVWMHQTIFVKDQIIDSVNKKLNMKFVKNIRFTLDRHAVPAESAPQEGLRENLKKFSSDP